MKAAKLLILPALILSTTRFFAQTATASNAATGARQIAPGSLLRIFWSVPNGVGDPNPPGVSVKLRPQGTGEIFEPQVIGAVQPSVLVLVPQDVPSGATDVLLTVNSTAFPPTQVTVAPAAVGVFTSFGNFGPAAAQNVAADSVPQLNRLTSPAIPGEYVILWSTGLGGFTTPDMTISLAGEPVQPTFAAPAPGLPGVDQINFAVPVDAPLGCYVPLTVSAGGSTSNSVALSIASSPGACQYPLGLSAAQLQMLDQGQSAFAGSFAFFAPIQPPGPNAPGYTRVESFNAELRDRSAFEIYLMSPKTEASARRLGSQCALFTSGAILSAISGATGNPAGPLLTLTGPSKQSLTVPAAGLGYDLSLPSPPAVSTPDQLPPPFFVLGSWQISAPGGDPVLAFQQAYLLPPQISWTNRELLSTFSRDADLQINWDSHGYTSRDLLQISILTPETSISCSASAQSGSLVVPVPLLQNLPPGPGLLDLFVVPQTPTVFNLALTSGAAAPAVMSYAFSDSLNVIIQ